MTATTWVNGEPAAQLRADDRGLLYGDGLFETLAVRRGHVRHLTLHLARLARGCERLRIAMPARALLAAELQALCAGRERALLRLTLTRGPARARGYRPTGSELATRIAALHDWPAPVDLPFRTQLSAVRLACQPLLAGLKHLNRLEQVLAQQAAAAAGVHEALMLDSHGGLVCGSMGNVYVRIRGQWLTPPIIDCGVAGITRQRLLEGAGGAGFSPREEQMGAEGLARAECIAISNVRLGLQVVHWHEGRELGVDPVLARVQEALDADGQ
jgi:4-amino-4-deoxychorismate lyase